MDYSFGGMETSVVTKLRNLDAYSSTDEVKAAYSKIAEHLTVLSYNHNSITAQFNDRPFLFYVNEIMDARMNALSEALDAVDSGVPTWRFHNLFRAHAGYTRQIFSAMRNHPSYPYIIKDHPDFPAMLSAVENSPDIPAVLQ